ncbi:MAG: hypothetical protein NTZ27_10475 [Ignavibacteriales bacterium]|nr:hypothetical protein [Ignavibacteriales bacterium]
MAENTDTGDETLEDPINIESVNTSDKNISSKEPDTLTPKKESENMETHAHHLHNAPGQNFWHYFYEFLMLFFAVFAGFLAENQREHYVEGKRGKEFMVSLVKDLQSDTAQFSRIRMYRLDKLRTMDSLIIFFVNHTTGPVPAHGYTLAIKLFGHFGFFQTSGTLDQLKSSGGLRLISHRNVVESIESYDQQTKRIALRDLYETNFSFDNNTILQKLFDGRALLKIYADTTYYKKPASPSAVIKLNEQYLDEFLNSLRTFQYLVRLDMDLQVAVKEKATELISLIKKEYELE